LYETVVKKEDILEIGQTLQKLKEMHEANDRVLEQLRRQQGSYVVEDSEEKPSIVSTSYNR
jgi:hypothetical protein